MAFLDDVAHLSEQITKRLPHVNGEEATKQALILPFLTALGYDIYDPTEVRPEFIADFAKKKAGQFEKVDYAIFKDGAAVMFIEAKSKGELPEAHDGQLQRYFNAFPTARVGIVTNGTEYRFFTDLREQNIMDGDPFMTFDLIKFTNKDVESVRPFHRDNFDTAAISAYAEELVYLRAMTKVVGELLRSPSEAFVRFLVKELGFAGVVTARVIEKFDPIVKKALQSSLVDLMTRSISQEISQAVAEPPQVSPPEQVEQVSSEEETRTVVTTPEEIEAFELIRAIVAHSPVGKAIYAKDVASYFSVHLGKITRWFVRLVLNPKQKYLLFRLPLSDVAPLAPAFRAEQWGEGCKLHIDAVGDLDALYDVIIRAYEVETGRK